LYIPKYNKAANEHEIFRFMRENPFAIIVSTNEGKIIATHVPVEIEENDQNQKVIRTHIAKANPMEKLFRKQRFACNF
jgi:transcriptional regulator